MLPVIDGGSADPSITSWIMTGRGNGLIGASATQRPAGRMTDESASVPGESTGGPVGFDASSIGTGVRATRTDASIAGRSRWVVDLIMPASPGDIGWVGAVEEPWSVGHAESYWIA